MLGMFVQLLVEFFQDGKLLVQFLVVVLEVLVKNNFVLVVEMKLGDIDGVDVLVVVENVEVGFYELEQEDVFVFLLMVLDVQIYVVELFGGFEYVVFEFIVLVNGGQCVVEIQVFGVDVVDMCFDVVGVDG